MADETIAKLRESFGPDLAWVGPVYHLGGHSERLDQEDLFCPLPHVILVRTRRGADGSLQQALTAAGAKVTEDVERTKYLAGFHYVVINDPARTSAYDLRDRLLRESPEVVAEVRFENTPMILPTAAVPDDTLWPQQWNMNRIQAPAAWDISTGSSSVLVCVLDSGCDLSHPDLVFADPGINLGSMSGDGSPTGPHDAIPHGTACAGIVAATFDNAEGVAGVAGTCQLLPAAIVTWSDAEVAAGIGWATAHGASVISMSFGDPTWDPLVIDPAILAAFGAGLVMCAATGNEEIASIRYPATNPYVLGVGASDQTDERKSPLSADQENWGSNFGPEMSVAAPGVLVPTTDIAGDFGYNYNGGEGYWSDVFYPSLGDALGNYVAVFGGTSAATPHVAGLAALLLSQYPSLSNVEVRTLIERTADKTGATASAETTGYPNGTWNQHLGYGRINALSALDHAGVMIRDWAGDVGAEPSNPPAGNFWNYSDLVVRINDDDVFMPGDPTQSKNLEIGQTNFLYVRVRNLGPREARDVVVSARIVPYVGTQFVYPNDWTAVDATHLSPTPMTATFPVIASGAEEIAKFSISAAQVEILFSEDWHPCVVALVTAENDYAFATSAFTDNPVVARRSNLAQRNLTLINVLPDALACFPFLAGHALNDERFIELVIDRSALPTTMPLRLALDGENIHFPRVDVDGAAGCDHDEVVFLDRTRLETRFKCCKGVLTLEKGSRFECRHPKRVGDVDVTGGEVVLDGSDRVVKILDDTAVIRLDKQAGQLLPLVLQTRATAEILRGGPWEVSVTQRNTEHHIVGGASGVFIAR